MRPATVGSGSECQLGAGSVDLLARAGALRAVLACAMEAQEGYEDGLASDERDTPNRMRSPPLSAPQSLQASLPTTRVGESRIREGPGLIRACTRYAKSHTSPVAYIQGGRS